MFRRPIHAGAALIAASLAIATGCGHHGSTRVSVPATPAPVGWTENGVASWYGVPYDGRRTSSGEIFDMRAMTAAHRTLPFNTWLEVTNLKNGKQVEVRITDRGPFVDGRIIDLSMGAAQRIDMVRDGIVKVHLKVIKRPLTQQPPLTQRSPSTQQPPLKQQPSAADSPSSDTVPTETR